MLNFQFGHSRANSRVVSRSARIAPYLALPVALLVLVSTYAFRPTPVITLPVEALANPLNLPPGWPTPPTPADNPITPEKFALGRYLFFEVGLSGDNKTSCGSCHNSRLSFAARGTHAGAFSDTSKPARMVPRLMNLAYDSVYTWDGHIHSLEEQVHIAVVKKGDLQADTTVAFGRLAKNPAYVALFTQAFGDGAITLDRIAQAIATYERCLISANSPYDQYLNGDSSAFPASARRGMQIFFDTNTSNCSFCHSNIGLDNPNVAGQTFTDNNYYRTGTFEPNDPRSGYGFDTTRAQDPGRAGVTKDSADLGKFRTPSLRNVCLTPPFGADGSVFSLSQLLANYNHGGDTTKTLKNKAARIKPLHLDSAQVQDLASFLNALTDLSYISNPAFQDPGTPTASVDDRIIAGRLTLYPNPASGFVTVESPDLAGQTSVNLISERGVTVWHRNLIADGRLNLDFTTVASGAYRLELQSGNSRQSSQIVIQH